MLFIKNAKFDSTGNLVALFIYINTPVAPPPTTKQNFHEATSTERCRAVSSKFHPISNGNLQLKFSGKHYRPAEESRKRPAQEAKLYNIRGGPTFEDDFEVLSRIISLHKEVRGQLREYDHNDPQCRLDLRENLLNPRYFFLIKRNYFPFTRTLTHIERNNRLYNQCSLMLNRLILMNLGCSNVDIYKICFSTGENDTHAPTEETFATDSDKELAMKAVATLAPAIMSTNVDMTQLLESVVDVRQIQKYGIPDGNDRGA